MVNAENIRRVADAIEAAAAPDATPELGFNMRVWRSKDSPYYRDLTGHGCGTVACVGGWACHVLGGHPQDETFAAEALGLDAKGAWDLFYGDGLDARASPQQAVRTLRHLADTGVVDWTV